MKVSKIFSTALYKEIQDRVKNLINDQEDFLTAATKNSTRAAGDAIQSIIETNFESILGDICSEYSSQFARRAMADLAFKDKDGFYYVVDVKTHRMDTKFNMPNLTSVERLARFYEDDANYFVILNISYNVQGNKLIVADVQFIPIEFLHWDCLTIGALGWGQIQIANSNKIIVIEQDRTQWMKQLCEILLTFYPKEISKINSRIEYFKGVSTKWGKQL